jgi:hypothetical protein
MFLVSGMTKTRRFRNCFFDHENGYVRDVKQDLKKPKSDRTPLDIIVWETSRLLYLQLFHKEFECLQDKTVPCRV